MIVHHNPTTPTTKHKNKWESDILMDIYYVVGVNAIPYLGLGVIINIISKHDNTYYVIIIDIP
jgi:hypothetical protein